MLETGVKLQHPVTLGSTLTSKTTATASQFCPHFVTQTFGLQEFEKTI